MNEEHKNQQEWNRIAEKRLDISNTEMGVVKNDIQWIKSAVSSMDKRIWAVVIGVIGILIRVLLK